MYKLLTSGMWIGLLLTTWPLQADTTFTLDPPGGAISGLPGQTIGWGFTFTNDTDYAVITSMQFCDAASVLPGACLPVTPSLGTFTDFTPLQPLLVVGPSPESTTLTQSFDGSLFTGVGSFAIDPGALGTSAGLIVVTYDLFKESPNDPQFTGDEVGGGLFLTAPASASAVPEPSAWPLLLTGGLLIEISRRVRSTSGVGSRRNQARAKKAACEGSTLAAAQAAKTPSEATLTMALTGKNEIVGTLYYKSPGGPASPANNLKCLP